MSTFPGSPRVLKGGIVLIDPDSGAVQRIIVLQYNPETVSRTLAPQAASGDGARSEALRLKGPPVETIKLDASSLIVSTGGPFSRNASDRAPSPLAACGASVRETVSGLYCSTMMRCTAPLSGSIRTMPPLRTRGEPGNVDMGARERIRGGFSYSVGR